MSIHPLAAISDGSEHDEGRPMRASRTLSWKRSERGDGRLVIETLKWTKAGSGRRVIHEGDFYDPTIDGPVLTAERLAGRVVDTRRYAEGELLTPRRRLPRATAEDVDRLLFDYGFRAGANGDELVQIVGRIFRHWTLTDEQHRQLLRRVLLADDLLILGSAIDPLGRDVMRIGRGPSPHAPTAALLVSHRVHRVVGQERVVVDEGGMTVTAFRLWGFLHEVGVIPARQR